MANQEQENLPNDENGISIEIDANAVEVSGDVEALEIDAEIDEGTEAETVEVIETVADASVAIAEIEANRDVEIAQIGAAVEIEHIEARKEEKGELWERMENLSTQVENLAETVSQLSASLLTPQLSAEADPTTTTPQFTPDPMIETPMEVEPESVVEKVEAEITESLPTKRRPRAI